MENRNKKKEWMIEQFFRMWPRALFHMQKGRRFQALMQTLRIFEEPDAALIHGIWKCSRSSELFPTSAVDLL
jgi:hypothetical protein